MIGKVNIHAGRVWASPLQVRRERGHKVESLESKPMKSETITERADLIIRRHVLEPGEALPWHTDRCHRFTVVVRGELIRIEYRDSDEAQNIAVHPGLADWDAPQPKVHRGVNAGTVPYEEVIMFFLDEPGAEPQPEAGEPEG